MNENKMGGSCNTHGDVKKCVLTFLVWIPKGKRPFEVSRRKWEDNIKTDLKSNRVWDCGPNSSYSG